MLDVMCGYGRHALRLAGRGYRVHAIDNSKEYIEEIKGVAARAGLPVVAETVGALEAQFPDQYRAVVIMGNSFAFSNKANTVSLLKKNSGSFIARRPVGHQLVHDRRNCNASLQTTRVDAA